MLNILQALGVPRECPSIKLLTALFYPALPFFSFGNKSIVTIIKFN